MRIVDYQSGRELRDVSVMLTEDELQDLVAYVQKLGSDSRVSRAHLSQVVGARLTSELTVAVEPRLSHPIAS